MSYKELEVGYQGLRAASFYIGDDTEQGASPSSTTTTNTVGSIFLQTEAGLVGDTLPTTFDYVYTSSSDPSRTKHPNCPICRLVSIICIYTLKHQYLLTSLLDSRVVNVWVCSGLLLFFLL